FARGRHPALKPARPQLAHEPQRVVQVLALDPRDAVAGPAQPLDGRGRDALGARRGEYGEEDAHGLRVRARWPLLIHCAWGRVSRCVANTHRYLCVFLSHASHTMSSAQGSTHAISSGRGVSVELTM